MLAQARRRSGSQTLGRHSFVRRPLLSKDLCATSKQSQTPPSTTSCALVNVARLLAPVWGAELPFRGYWLCRGGFVSMPEVWIVGRLRARSRVGAQGSDLRDTWHNRLESQRRTICEGLELIWLSSSRPAWDPTIGVFAQVQLRPCPPVFKRSHGRTLDSTLGDEERRPMPTNSRCGRKQQCRSDENCTCASKER